jgi:hypothetical protein
VRAVADVVIRFHVERCLMEAFHSGGLDEKEKRTRELIDIIGRYLRR